MSGRRDESPTSASAGLSSKPTSSARCGVTLRGEAQMKVVIIGLSVALVLGVVASLSWGIHERSQASDARIQAAHLSSELSDQRASTSRLQAQVSSLKKHVFVPACPRPSYAADGNM